MRRKTLITLFMAGALLGLTAALVSCGGKPGKRTTPNKGVSTIACDESFENIMQQEIGVFEYTYPTDNVIPYYVNGKAAVDSFLQLKVPSVIISRDLTKEERKYFKSKKKTAKSRMIAVDAVAVIVNPANSAEILSVKELQEILTGKVTDWNELEPNKTGKIAVVFDSHEGSSIAKYMRDSLTNGANFAPNVYGEKNTPDVIKRVRETKGAIGIVGVSWLSADLMNSTAAYADKAKSIEGDSISGITEYDTSVKVLKIRRNNSIEAYKPYQQYIYDGNYPLYRSIYMHTTGISGETSHCFFVFVTSEVGQKILLKTGILPAIVQPTMVSIN